MLRGSTKKLLLNLQWLRSIGIKIARVVPVHLLVTTVFTLLSQITLLLAFLLPIKILILLGSEGIPRYFPDALSLLPRDQLIASLTATAILAYLLHVLFDRWTLRLAEGGTRRILDRSRKLEIFENQEGRARRAYSQFTQGFAALVFLTAVLVGLVLFYPAIAAVLLVGVLLSVVACAVTYLVSVPFRQSAFARIIAHTSTTADLLFLLVFLFIVVDYLYGQPPSLLVGLISLILVRQWTQRLTGLISHGLGLIERRLEIASLFFHAQVAEQSPTAEQPALWQAIREQRQAPAFAEVLKAIELDEAEVRESRWLQTGFPGIAPFILRIGSGSGMPARSLLVKMFAKQRQTYASSELSLLTMSNADQLPAPALLDVTTVHGLSTHLYSVSNLEAFEPSKRLEAIARFRCALSSVTVPDEFLDRYHRSHPGPWIRLESALLDRLEIVASTDAQRSSLANLRAALPRIQSFLKSMPSSIVNIETTRQNVLEGEAGQPLSIHWGRWSIEPIGANWLMTELTSEQMPELLEQMVCSRPNLRDLPLSHMRFAAMTWDWERFYKKELFADCIDSVDELLEGFDVARGEVGAV